MRKITINLLFVLLLFSCNFIEPCYLSVCNNSEYKINARCTACPNEEFQIERGKSEFMLCSPGSVNLEIFIDEINFHREYGLSMGYMEKKKFDFNLN
jgi:hypothetical protein